MPPRMRVKAGPHKGKLYEVREEIITIGRDESQTIQILDQGVSRQHAEIFRLGEMIFLRDLNATNGTYLNNARVTEEMLRPGDEVLIGTTVLVFEDPDHAPVPQAEASDDPAMPDSDTKTVELRAGRHKTDSTRLKQVGGRNVVVLDQITEALRKDSDPDQAIKHMMDTVLRSVKASQAFHLRVERKSFHVRTCGMVEADDYSGERKISRTILRRVLQGGRAILSTDASMDERFALSESIVLRKIKSVICAPLQITDESADVLYLHADRSDDPFSVEDLELVGSISLLFEVLLSYSRSLEEARRRLVAAAASVARSAGTAPPGKSTHPERVAEYAAVLAFQLGFSPADVDLVRAGALVHHLGGAEEEASAAAAGEHLVAGVPGGADLAPFVKFRLERLDGSGPLGAAGDAVPRTVRLVIAACAFDRLASGSGADATPMPPADAIQALSKAAGEKFDKDVTQALFASHRTGALYGTPPEPS